MYELEILLRGAEKTTSHITKSVVKPHDFKSDATDEFNSLKIDGIYYDKARFKIEDVLFKEILYTKTMK